MATLEYVTEMTLRPLLAILVVIDNSKTHLQLFHLWLNLLISFRGQPRCPCNALHLQDTISAQTLWQTLQSPGDTIVLPVMSCDTPKLHG